jgi:predicted nucleotidyltransferase
MEIFETLNQKSREAGLQFLVMGGHAINAHGYERQTADVDILVRSKDREAWKTLLSSLGYRVFHEQDTFMQFSAPEAGAWPVDLMFVNEQTFSKMLAESIEVTMKGTGVKIPSVEHLIALKLHALKYTNPRRELKDLLDVVSLLEANKIDPNGGKFKELCERYGTQKIQNKIIAASSK